MDDKEFFDRLASALENIRKEHELDNKHDALLFWYLQYKYDLDPDDLKERIVHDHHAEGVDGVVLDRRQNAFYFVQGKSSQDFGGTAKPLPENDAKLTLSGVRFLLQGDYKGKITIELENLVDEYHDYEKSGDYKTIVLFIAERQDPVSTKFIEEFTQATGKSVEIITFAKIKEFYEKEYLVFRSPPPGKISFAVADEPLMKHSPYPSAVFSIKAEELAKTYEEHRERLFQQNVRDPMGVKGVINKLIFGTAIDPKSGNKFWYFNNGINIVCKKLHLAASGKVITLDEPQIINGAQTTHAIHEAYVNGQLVDGVEVLVKVAQVVDREFVDQITLYSNAQNAIRLRDLSSNDEVQDRLQKVLLDSYNVFYQRKRGEFDMMFPTAEAKTGRLGKDYHLLVADNEKIALAYLSTYLNKPVEARGEKYKVFYKDAGFYFDIFNNAVDNLAERFLLAWKLNQYIEQQKRAYRKKYNAEKKKEAPDVAVLDDFFITQADYFILSLMFMKLGKDRDLTETATIKEMLTKLDKADAEIASAHEFAVDLIRKQFVEDKTKPGNYINRFFKSQRTIVLLQEKAQTEI
jgi:hypothetical protein